jgi:predicted amidohydrolase
VKIAVALLDASKSGNELRDSIAKLTKTAKQNKAQIIVLPELSYSGYNPDRFAKDATLLDETASFFGDLARDNRIFIIAGAAVKSNNLTTNSALVFDNLGSLVSKYDKIHLFSKTAEQDVFLTAKTGAPEPRLAGAEVLKTVQEPDVSRVSNYRCCLFLMCLGWL